MCGLAPNEWKLSDERGRSQGCFHSWRRSPPLVRCSAGLGVWRVERCMGMLLVTIPLVMRETHLDDVCGVEGHLRIAAHLANKRAANDGNVFDGAPVGQRDRHDLVIHAGLRLREQELAPFGGQRGHTPNENKMSYRGAMARRLRKQQP